MQTVRSDYQTEPALASSFEFNLDAVRLLLEADNLIAENGLCLIFDLIEDQPRKVEIGRAHV